MAVVTPSIPLSSLLQSNLLCDSFFLIKRFYPGLAELKRLPSIESHKNSSLFLKVIKVGNTSLGEKVFYQSTDWLVVRHGTPGVQLSEVSTHAASWGVLGCSYLESPMFM